MTNTKDELCVALFLQTPHAFLFSGTAKIHKRKLQDLPPQLDYIVVHNALQSDIQRIKKPRIQNQGRHNENSLSSKKTNKKFITFTKHSNIESFMTYEPSTDSRFITYWNSNNSLNFAFNDHMRSFTLFNPFQSQQKQSFIPDKKDLMILKDFGFDVDLIEEVQDLYSEKSIVVDKDTNNDSVNDILNENFKLFVKLAELQDARFSLGLNVTSEERNTALALQNNLVEVASKFQPRDLITNPKSIEHAMSLVPSQYPVFGGTLPPQRLFVYSSNSGNPKTYPSSANVVIQKNNN
ncbi:hypothetical protein BB559_003925 [Furculomyces boomerangus]|uniref:Uncharacterized protein n=2 Tax=Harpellales TaxID=61421 RepID=A0A2T9YHW4_9FUNG|nr:hypothetical protein BB559_003925 [Furculomyces boomerangus]PVZ99114.1 hypothetical protein BB558_004874 [Smittium angustum]